MTRKDVKNYLEKIYKVPVANVRNLNHMGKVRKNVFRPNELVKDPDYKIAYVTLAEGHKFEWPDLKISGTAEANEKKASDDVDTAKEQYKKDVGQEQTKYRPGVPTFFGL